MQSFMNNCQRYGANTCQSAHQMNMGMIHNQHNLVSGMESLMIIWCDNQMMRGIVLSMKTIYLMKPG